MFPIRVFAAIQMLHLPDGFLSFPVAILCWLVTAAVLALAVRYAQDLFDERLIPLAGIMAAFIFAGQMINFPVAGGTSGHLVGATLAAIILGPWLALLVMTAVISLQALLFQDGGLVVMGGNILVMGIIPVMVGYGFYRAVLHRSQRLKLVAAGVAAWLSILAAAFVTALFLGASGTTRLDVAIPAMVGIHALIGIGEALITVAALSFVMRARPQMMASGATTGGRGWIVAGIALTAFLLLLAPLASSSPDGLEWVAGQNGFIDRALDAPFQLLPDYAIPSLGSSGASTVLAGAIGALVVAAVTYALIWLARRLKKIQPIAEREVSGD